MTTNTGPEVHIFIFVQGKKYQSNLKSEKAKKFPG